MKSLLSGIYTDVVWLMVPMSRGRCKVEPGSLGACRPYTLLLRYEIHIQTDTKTFYNLHRTSVYSF